MGRKDSSCPIRFCFSEVSHTHHFAVFKILDWSAWILVRCAFVFVEIENLSFWAVCFQKVCFQKVVIIWCSSMPLFGYYQMHDEDNLGSVALRSCCSTHRPLKLNQSSVRSDTNQRQGQLFEGKRFDRKVDAQSSFADDRRWNEDGCFETQQRSSGRFVWDIISWLSCHFIWQCWST